MNQLQALRATVGEFPSVLLGYSGGVDSALLALVLRQELGHERMVAAVGRSASFPAEQLAQARSLAAQFDIPILEIDTRELDDARYLANPTNRCFFCKSELWLRLGAVARERGFAVLCDGTNADDLREHRPGHAAGVASGVRSPLAEAGWSKQDVRAAARDLGLANWNAPASPCLSSRVQYGLHITPRRLQQVEEAERLLRRIGVTGDLRVRHHGALARIEVESSWIPWLTARLPDLTAPFVRIGFERVEVDPRGYRRGSLMLEGAAP